MSILARYTRSKKNNFKDGMNQDKLHNKIKSDSVLKNNFIGITTADDKVEILFERELNTNHLSRLNDIIDDHKYTDNENVPNNFFSVVTKNNSAKSDIYTMMARFSYSGTNNVGNIKQIVIVSRMDNGANDYGIRIYDKTNGNIISEIEKLKNTDDEIVIMNDIYNLPSTDAIIEVQMKKKGAILFNAHIDTIMVYYE